jgi:hypothetical protein
MSATPKLNMVFLQFTGTLYSSVIGNKKGINMSQSLSCFKERGNFSSSIQQGFILLPKLQATLYH